jgi:3-methylfumaryl-CoA hydratase
MDLEPLSAWIGHTETRAETITAAPMGALAATLDRDEGYPALGAELPILWHWIYFLPRARQCDLGPDGHPARGSAWPPVPLARRMWAGSRIEIRRPLRVGDEATRVSRITAITPKQARSGAMVFVTVTHEITTGSTLALTEVQDVVYMNRPEGAGPAKEPRPAPGAEDFSREIVIDPVLLFRYSALTFNAHRIHYDRPYATETEGYSGLIVHGPLVATLLGELLQRNMAPVGVQRFWFKAVKPLFDNEPFTLCGKAQSDRLVELWARDRQGALAAQARVELTGPSAAKPP